MTSPPTIARPQSYEVLQRCNQRFACLKSDEKCLVRGPECDHPSDSACTQLSKNELIPSTNLRICPMNQKT